MPLYTASFSNGAIQRRRSPIGYTHAWLAIAERTPERMKELNTLNKEASDGGFSRSAEQAHRNMRTVTNRWRKYGYTITLQEVVRVEIVRKVEP